MKRSIKPFGTAAAAAALVMLAFAACSGNAGLSSGPATVVPSAVGCAGSKAGSFSIGVYADATHQQAQCQFSLGSNATAYVLVKNVATSGRYVMYVQSSGSNPRCAYMSPMARGSNLLCNPSVPNVTGVNAPGGNVAFSWVFHPSLRPGSYSVAIYDQNADGGVGAVLGTVQVKITP